MRRVNLTKRREKIVQVIYATGQPRLLEFAITEQRQAVPAGATVFAICAGDRVVSQLDESFFAAISDQEYYNYMELLRDALKRERRRLRDRDPATQGRRFFKRLFALAGIEDAAIHQSGS